MVGDMMYRHDVDGQMLELFLLGQVRQMHLDAMRHMRFINSLYPFTGVNQMVL